MILLGILLILELYIYCWLLGGRFLLFLQVHFDLTSLLFVLLGVVGFITIRGRRPFLAGLAALIRLPKQGNPEIARYYRQLTVFTLLWSVLGMALFCAGSLSLVRLPDIIGSFLAMSIFTFTYAAWSALMLFWPISIRYSIGTEDDSEIRKPFPIADTLLGIAAFFLTRALMAILFVTMATWVYPNGLFPKGLGDVEIVLRITAFSWNPADWSGDLFDYLHPWLYFDTPSFIVILLSLGAFRLAAGPIKNRFVWVPVSIVIGVLWTLEGFTIMLCDLDPMKYGAGTMVALLTAFYGFLAAVFFAIGSKRLVVLFFLALPIWGLATGVIEFADRMQQGHQFTQLDCYACIMLVLFYFAFQIIFALILWDGIKKFVPGFKAKPEEPLPPEEEQARQVLDSAVTRHRKGE